MGIFFFICTACFGQNTQEIDNLIKFGLNKNFNLIQEEAANFEYTELLDIYDRHKKNLWLGGVGGLVNLFPPLILLPNFGIGNFIQKDCLGGTITLAGTVLGGGLLFLGISNWGVVVPFSVIPSGNTSNNNSNKIWPIVTITGGVIFYASSIFGIVRAVAYPFIYNKKLKTALNFNQTTVDIEPSLSITENGLNLTLVSMEW
jgi:hypothetical protein